MTICNATLRKRIVHTLFLGGLLISPALVLSSCGDDESVCQQAADKIERCATQSEISRTAEEFLAGCKEDPDAYKGWTDCLDNADCDDAFIMRCFAGYE